MPTKPIFPIIATACLLAACSRADKAVEYPFIESANTMTLDIAKVELTDTATILHTDAYFRPHNWIRIDAKSYLTADGKKYMLTGAQGIQPDSLFWMPDSGEASFTLIFEPMPKRTRSFDFIESDCEDCFKLYGIDLTGKRTYDALADAPAVDGNAPVPDPVFRSGETTLRLHLLGYRETLGKELNVYVNTLFGDQQPYTCPIDAEGNATLSFMQYGPAQALVDAAHSFIELLWLAPGDTADVYLNMQASGWRILARRAEKGKAPQPAPLQSLYATGTYANLTNAYAMHRERFMLDLYDNEPPVYAMSSQEYAAFVTEQYHTLTDSIGRSSLPQLLKELWQLSLRQETLYALTSGDFVREYSYRQAHSEWGREPVKGIDPIKEEDVKAVCQLFDINDPKLLMGTDFLSYVSTIGWSDFDLPGLTGIRNGLVVDLPKVLPLVSQAESLSLTDDDRKTLASMENPFYLEALEKMEAKTQADLAAVEGKAKIETTPNVPLAQLFDAIIAPYRGKVMLVDFWNTWCGPCRMALKAIEPLKGGELQSDDLVWLYIANETSPLVTYNTMIPNIQGVHYRLNAEQWKALAEKFQIDGIPSYVLVDKSGAYKLRNDLRDHNLMRETLKGMIAE